MHSIIAKEPNQACATTVYETSLINFTPDVVNTIKQRIIDSAGRGSKAFELEIEQFQDGSFYSLCQDLKSLNDQDFISRSQDIVELLASHQTRSNYPGGFLIVIDGEDPINHHAIYIIIKAELHQALTSSKTNNQTMINLISDVFLSPSQKLFKIGILYEKSLNPHEELNTRFGCFLFDDQFRPNGHPAEYFYKDFLGFSVGSNAKIQSKIFYDQTESFIKSKILDFNVKQDLLRALKTEFTLNNNPTLSPSVFGQTFFADQQIKDEYDSIIVEDLPTSFVKDKTLIGTKLERKKLDFPSKINITGPDSDFDTNVTIIQDEVSLSALDPTAGTYTIVKILGKPFTNEP